MPLVNNFTIRKAELEDAETICEVMKKAEAALEDKTLYVCDDLDYVKAHIMVSESNVNENGFGIVACSEDGKIVGIFIIRYPQKADDNLGRDMRFSDTELLQVVHMESAAVLPEYRGNHLQEKMLRYAESFIDKKNYHYLMATVSPDNPASYLTFEKCGYQLMKTKEKYGGLMRRIYLKRV